MIGDGWFGLVCVFIEEVVVKEEEVEEKPGDATWLYSLSNVVKPEDEGLSQGVGHERSPLLQEVLGNRDPFRYVWCLVLRKVNSVDEMTSWTTFYQAGI
jgi:hypothetical protein